jgi:hypothetical protein
MRGGSVVFLMGGTYEAVEMDPGGIIYIPSLLGRE